MRRVGRIIFGGAAAGSAGVALLVAVAWGVGQRRSVVIEGRAARTYADLVAHRECVELWVFRSDPPPAGQRWSVRMAPGSGPTPVRIVRKFFGVPPWQYGGALWAHGIYRNPSRGMTIGQYLVVVPYWALLAASLALPGAWVGRWVIARRRRRRQGGRGFQVEGPRAED